MHLGALGIQESGEVMKKSDKYPWHKLQKVGDYFIANDYCEAVTKNVRMYLSNYPKKGTGGRRPFKVAVLPEPTGIYKVWFKEWL